MQTLPVQARAPHLCFMSPHMVRFVRTPFFLFNSRFDAWQLAEDLRVPCFHPVEANHTACDASEQAAIVRYGQDFLDALAPVAAVAGADGALSTGVNWY